jgi:hypothetical protein
MALVSEENHSTNSSSNTSLPPESSSESESLDDALSPDEITSGQCKPIDVVVKFEGE